MSNTQDRIAARIKARRKELHKSQEHVARALGVYARTYGRWERCESYGFIERLTDIAEALETTESDLLNGEDRISVQPTVQQVSEKLDRVLKELADIREQLSGPPEQGRSAGLG